MSLFGIGRRYYRPFNRRFSKNLSTRGRLYVGHKRAKTIAWKVNRRFKYSPYNFRRLKKGV